MRQHPEHPKNEEKIEGIIFADLSVFDNFGDLTAAIRRAQGLTTEELAKRYGSGCTRQNITMLENAPDWSIPKTETFRKLAKALKLEPVLSGKFEEFAELLRIRHSPPAPSQGVTVRDITASDERRAFRDRFLAYAQAHEITAGKIQRALAQKPVILNMVDVTVENVFEGRCIPQQRTINALLAALSRLGEEHRFTDSNDFMRKTRRFATQEACITG